MKDWLENLGWVFVAVLVYLLVGLVFGVVVGRLPLIWAITKGFVLLSVLIVAEQIVHALLLNVLRLSELEHIGVVIFNLLITLVFCVAWAAFLALEVTRAAYTVGWFGVGLLHVLGVLGAWLGFGVVTGFFVGSLYRISGLFTALIGYVLFAFFPGWADALFGWFFALWV